MEDENTRSIGDMYFAAALLAYDAILVGVNREDRRRQRFEFKDTDLKVYIMDGGNAKEVLAPISRIETFFVAKSLMYPPSYPDAIRRIKSAIHGYE